MPQLEHDRPALLDDFFIEANFRIAVVRAVAVISKRGVLRAKRHGKVRIKISSKDGSNKKIYKKIKVKARAKSLKLKGISHTCFVGKTFKIEPVIKPKKAGTKYIRYKSSNKRIATISVKKGIIKGLRPEVVTITAKTSKIGRASCRERV